MNSEFNTGTPSSIMPYDHQSMVEGMTTQPCGRYRVSRLPPEPQQSCWSCLSNLAIESDADPDNLCRNFMAESLGVGYQQVARGRPHIRRPPPCVFLPFLQRRARGDGMISTEILMKEAERLDEMIKYLPKAYCRNGRPLTEDWIVERVGGMTTMNTTVVPIEDDMTTDDSDTQDPVIISQPPPIPLRLPTLPPPCRVTAVSPSHMNISPRCQAVPRPITYQVTSYPSTIVVPTRQSRMRQADVQQSTQPPQQGMVNSEPLKTYTLRRDHSSQSQEKESKDSPKEIPPKPKDEYQRNPEVSAELSTTSPIPSAEASIHSTSKSVKSKAEGFGRSNTPTSHYNDAFPKESVDYSRHHGKQDKENRESNAFVCLNYPPEELPHALCTLNKRSNLRRSHNCGKRGNSSQTKKFCRLPSPRKWEVIGPF